ncbi:aminomethyl-transferring glycine dehydrogenase subunit GcvPA [bacterium]|nr:aminomethyl-transferring glycine dehydrogenase subunit GcvPA [bacterium]
MRFHPHTAAVRKDMLAEIGVKSIDDLYQAVPEKARNAKIDLPAGMGEIEIESKLGKLASKNRAANAGPFFLGAGCYYHHVPATVDMVIQRSEFLTAYTPYQPEIAQGTLTVIFEYQSIIAALTGMDVANASMYDGATALAEAVLMARRLTKRTEYAVFGALHPDYAGVTNTYWMEQGGTVTGFDAISDKTAAVVVQYPDYHGNIPDLKAVRVACDKVGAKMIVCVTEILALGALPAPAMADIVLGEAQSIGVGMNYGGPHLGFFASKNEYLRQMPGRLCGRTEDADGKPGFVLTLSTREQHIRREKATSNICSNQGLMALAFTVHASLLGEVGFKKLALLNHERACELADALAAVPGVKVVNQSFFNEFVIETPKDARQLRDVLMEKHNIVAGHPLEGNHLLVAATEMTTQADIAAYASALRNSL